MKNTNVNKWYTENLGRVGDNEGLDFWTKAVNAIGADVETIFQSFKEIAIGNSKANGGNELPWGTTL